MSRMIHLAWIAVLLALPAAAAAQQSDPIDDLLNASRRAFADLEYRAADSLANVVLGVPGINRSQRIQALQLAAAARYPAVDNQRLRDSAVTALRALIRIAPRASLPRILTWPGLDSLLAGVRTTTFGVGVTAAETTVVHGITGRASLDVVATRPTIFELRIVRPGVTGAGELIDSIGPVDQGTLSFVPVQSDVPRYPTGAYRLVVRARDPASGEVLEIGYAAEFSMPRVDVVPLPHFVDSTLLRPEHAQPSRARAVIAGVVLGAFTFSSVRLLRNDQLKGSGGAPDSRAGPWAIGLGISTSALAWYFDRGQVIESNVAYNREVRGKFAERQGAILAANDVARREYHGVIRLTLEER